MEILLLLVLIFFVAPWLLAKRDIMFGQLGVNQSVLIRAGKQFAREVFHHSLFWDESRGECRERTKTDTDNRSWYMRFLNDVLGVYFFYWPFIENIVEYKLRRQKRYSVSEEAKVREKYEKTGELVGIDRVGDTLIVTLVTTATRIYHRSGRVALYTDHESSDKVKVILALEYQLLICNGMAAFTKVLPEGSFFETVVDGFLRSVVKEQMASTEVSVLISGHEGYGKSAIEGPASQSAFQDAIQNKFNEIPQVQELFLRIGQVRVTEADFASEDVKQRYENVRKAAYDLETAKVDKEKKIVDSEARKQELIIEAQGEKESTILKAEGAAEAKRKEGAAAVAIARSFVRTAKTPSERKLVETIVQADAVKSSTGQNIISWNTGGNQSPAPPVILDASGRKIE